MIAAFMIGVALGQDFGFVKTERLMHDQMRYAGSLWDVSAWTGPGREGHSEYVVIQADGKVVFSTKEDEEIARLGIGFLSGADGVPYIVFRTYAYAGSGAWTKIFRMKRGGGLQIVFEEDDYFDAFHDNRDIGGPVFRDLDGDGKEEWIWDDFCSYEGGDPPAHLIAFKPDQAGVLKIWKKMSNRNGIRLPALAGVATEGDKLIFFDRIQE